MAVRPCLALVALFALLLVPPAATSSHSQRASESRVFVVVLENREYGEVVGNREAPFLDSLARRGTLATHYYAVAHPSLPNYLALLGGSTFGISRNCTECSAPGSNLALQLSRAGVSWRAYMGGMPRPCFGGAEAGDYVKRHNPFMHFRSIASSRERCGQVVPATRLGADLRRRALPAFGWLSPNLCDSGHDCDLATADRYMSRLIPRITRQLGPGGVVVVTFDEGTSDAGCCGMAGSAGGRVMTVVAGPGRPAASLTAGTYDHYSLLAALERHFGVPRLREARHSRALPLTGPGS
jgi:phosphatidylinositol-3-phosphatase